MIEALIFSIGAAFGYFMAWNNWLKNEIPKQNVIVDQKVLDAITTQMAMAWAERRGLVWMPKGAVFDSAKKTKHG